MTQSPYNLLMLDLDGTGLTRDETVSPAVAKAVKKVSRLIPTSIATGRERDDALKFAHELGLDTPQVSDNGALIVDPSTGRALWSRPLAKDQAQAIVTRLHQLDSTFIATHAHGTFRSLDEVDHWELTRVSAMDADREWAERLVASFERVGDLDAVKVFLPYNGLWAVDFTRAGVHKGAAAHALGELSGVGSSGIIAAGDSYNDVPMLEVAALKIVMGDAPEEIQAIADFVAPSVDEDGLATAIEEFIIPRL